MIAITRLVVRHRLAVLLAWLGLVVLGGMAASGLGDLLTNRFSVPGAEAERGLNVLKDRMGERSDGAFTLVVAPAGARPGAALAREARAAVRRAAGAVPGAKAGPLQRARGGVLFAEVLTPLQNADAGPRTPAMRRAIGSVPGARTYLTGFPALNHDTTSILSEDLARGERIAAPIAIVVLALMLGTLVGLAVPLLFALVTIPPTLGIVWVFAHFMDTAVYVTNLVTLIGLGIAIDYSMLVVFRFREELARGGDVQPALERTMATAGRATVFSGMTVAVGLALLVFMPLPFMRSLGLGGLFIPLVAIVASMTFLPALLATLGHRVNRLRIVPRRVLTARAANETGGGWHRLALAIMRRPVPFLLGSAAVMLALAAPALGLHVTGGDNRGIPVTKESTRGLKVLEDAIGPGVLAPHQIVVDTGRPGGAWAPATVAAERRLVSALRADAGIQPSTIQAPVLLAPGSGRPAARRLAALRAANLVDASGGLIQIRAAGRTDAGTAQAISLVHRLRDRLIPAARFGDADVLVTGAPAFGVDFVDKAFGAFPWLVLGVLVVSYALLLRAFRSVLLPAKAVLMNLLSVSATYGVLVLAFQHGWGSGLGLFATPQIDAFVPILLFALLFGLSMDYEVFLLSRMREEWDAGRPNAEAVAHGLEKTGRIITAAAVIMVAAFAGLTAGSFVSLQEFGVGLSAAILLDATLVRALLVPAAMRLLGRWNWWMPARLGRALRLAER